MNSRIYSKSIYDKHLEDLKNKLLYCPKCFKNNISNSDGPFIYFGTDLICLSCKFCSIKSDFLNKKDIRNRKIDEVLKK